MKKEKKTFAQRAKDIKAKYTRAEWDELERKDMTRELRALRDEQEAYRTSMGIGEQSEPSEEQELSGFDPSQFLNLNTIKSIVGGAGKINPVNGVSLDRIPAFGNTKVGGSQIVNNLAKNITGGWGMPSVSPIPTLVSAGMGMLGDIVGMKNYNKNMPPNVNLGQIQSQDVSLESQRENLRRGANQTSNTILANSRNASSPSNVYANQIAGLTGLYDSLGSGLSQSYLGEAELNSQNRMRTNMVNAQLRGEEAQLNTNLGMNRVAGQSKYLDDMFTIPGQAMRDYSAQNQQAAMMGVYGKDYGLQQYNDPNANSWQKFIQSFSPKYRIYKR